MRLLIETDFIIKKTDGEFWTMIRKKIMAFLLVSAMMLPFAPCCNALSESVGSLTVESTVTFGSYEQDNNAANGKENIEWIVLDQKDNKVLLMSKYGLDCQQYNIYNMNTTWKDSSVRKWLNDTFLKSAFTDEEQLQIATTQVTTADNPKYGTRAGSDTEDKVFLLSAEEVEEYLNAEADRICVPTAYAVSRGAWTGNSANKDGASCWWWLRTPGFQSNAESAVDYFGVTDYTGSYVDRCVDCVRPALWMDVGQFSNESKNAVNNNLKDSTAKSSEGGFSPTYLYGAESSAVKPGSASSNGSFDVKEVNKRIQNYLNYKFINTGVTAAVTEEKTGSNVYGITLNDVKIGYLYYNCFDSATGSVKEDGTINHIGYVSVPVSTEDKESYELESGSFSIVLPAIMYGADNSLTYGSLKDKMVDDFLPDKVNTENEYTYNNFSYIGVIKNMQNIVTFQFDVDVT